MKCFSISSQKVAVLKKVLGLLLLLMITLSFKKPPPRFLILIDKSDYLLTVYENDDIAGEYNCTFGNADQEKKQVQGDRKTPEGEYAICAKNPHEKWDKFLCINYPNAADRKEFTRKKLLGLLPPEAKLGGDIGIHGTWENEDYAVTRKLPWTLGCISIINTDIEQLYDMVPVGTRVVIRQ